MRADGSAADRPTEARGAALAPLLEHVLARLFVELARIALHSDAR
jgi:hypothetical protein